MRSNRGIRAAGRLVGGRVATRLAASLGCMALLAMAPVTTAAQDTGPRAGIDAMPPVPYAFNRAVLYADDGFRESAALYGLARDGRRVPLFRYEGAYAKSVEAVFYAEADLDALVLEYPDGRGGTGSAILPLPYVDTTGDAETAALEALPFPFREAPPSPGRGPVEVDGGNPAWAAEIALSTLFAPSRRDGPILALLCWFTVACTGAFVVSKRSARRPPPATAVAVYCALALAGAAAMLALVRPRAELYVLELPDPGASVAVSPSTVDSGSYETVRWGASFEPALVFIGLRSPSEPAVPVAALDGFKRIRTRPAPVVVTGEDGVPRLAVSSFMSAWGLP